VTYAERILDYLWSVAPEGATNGELARQLGIRSQQTVYMLTQELMRAGRIRGQRSGATWVFHAAEETATSPAMGLPRANDGLPATRLEVFGNDRQVPVRWLERYGELASAVTFYFLSDAGNLERLGGPNR
jgi:hypothetical protein